MNFHVPLSTHTLATFVLMVKFQAYKMEAGGWLPSYEKVACSEPLVGGSSLGAMLGLYNIRAVQQVTHQT